MALITSEPIRFRVVGLPKPAGSKRAFRNPKTDGIILVDSSGKPGKDWRAAVQHVALDVMGDRPLLTCALALDVTFYLPRAKTHFGSGPNAGKLKDSAPVYPAKKPDVTKLLRAVEDSLTGVVWRDDAQVVNQGAHKVYADHCGPYVDVQIALLDTADDERPEGGTTSNDPRGPGQRAEGER